MLLMHHNCRSPYNHPACAFSMLQKKKKISTKLMCPCLQLCTFGCRTNGEAHNPNLLMHSVIDGKEANKTHQENRMINQRITSARIWVNRQYFHSIYRGVLCSLDELEEKCPVCFYLTASYLSIQQNSQGEQTSFSCSLTESCFVWIKLNFKTLVESFPQPKEGGVS